MPAAMSTRVRLRRARSGIGLARAAMAVGRRGGSGVRGEKSGTWPRGGPFSGRPPRRSITPLLFLNDIFAHVAPQYLGDGYRTVRPLTVLDYLAKDARHRECGVVERVHVAHRTLALAV